ncbi:MAG: flagellar biosynthetic protein FliO [Chloroflexota bacterium]
MPDLLSDSTFSAGWELFIVLLKLAIVLGLIYAVFAILQRIKGGNFGQPGFKRMAVVETLYLTPKQKLHLVRVGEKVMMIGATDENLSLLSGEVVLPPEPVPPIEIKTANPTEYLKNSLVHFLKQILPGSVTRSKPME